MFNNQNSFKRNDVYSLKPGPNPKGSSGLNIKSLETVFACVKKEYFYLWSSIQPKLLSLTSSFNQLLISSEFIAEVSNGFLDLYITVFRLFVIAKKEYFYFCPSIKPKSLPSSANHFLISSDDIAEVPKTNNRWHKNFANTCFVILCNTMIYFSINQKNIVCVHQLGDFCSYSFRNGSGNLWSGFGGPCLKIGQFLIVFWFSGFLLKADIT